MNRMLVQMFGEERLQDKVPNSKLFACSQMTIGVASRIDAMTDN